MSGKLQPVVFGTELPVDGDTLYSNKYYTVILGKRRLKDEAEGLPAYLLYNKAIGVVEAEINTLWNAVELADQFEGYLMALKDATEERGQSDDPDLDELRSVLDF